MTPERLVEIHAIAQRTPGEPSVAINQLLDEVDRLTAALREIEGLLEIYPLHTIAGEASRAHAVAVAALTKDVT